MKKLRAAVIGCGAIAHHCHIPGYLADKACEVVALSDPSKENLQHAMNQFGIGQGYTDTARMLKEEKPDLVSVCSPNRFHAEQAILALEAGCHVLCEKPLCLSRTEANRLQKAHHKAKTLFMVAFSHRFFKGNIKARQALERGDIGKLFMLRIRFAHQGPDNDWMMSKSFFTPSLAGGGALFDMGIHAIDLSMYFFGKIKKLSAMMGTLVKKIPMEDNAILQFTFESGNLGYAEVGWTTKQGFSGIELYGSEGCIVIDYNGEAYRLSGSTAASGKRTVRKTVIEKIPLTGGWPAQMEHFIRCVRRGEQPEMDLEAGIESMKVALAAYESCKKGKIITL